MAWLQRFNFIARARLERELWDAFERGEPIDTILADLDRVVMPGIVHWQHPGWFAYFPANSSFESILGELASAGLGKERLFICKVFVDSRRRDLGMT